MSAAQTGKFQTASEPQKQVWRQDVNSWLHTHHKYVAKSLSVGQMGELRMLYDALDEDGSDSLDVDELAVAMRVCGLKEEQCKPVAEKLLEWMGKSRFETLAFAEFAYAVLHAKIPVGRKLQSFGVAERTEPLFLKIAHNDTRTSFSQAVLEFKRHRLYAQSVGHSLAARESQS
jgi:hypothetical protein